MIEPTNGWKAKVVMFIAEHTPKCHDITRLVSEAMDRPLPLRTRLAMRMHYLICIWCQRYRDQLGFVRDALQSCPTDDIDRARGKLSPEARNRLKIALPPKE